MRLWAWVAAMDQVHLVSPVLVWWVEPRDRVGSVLHARVAVAVLRTTDTIVKTLCSFGEQRIGWRKMRTSAGVVEAGSITRAGGAPRGRQVGGQPAAGGPGGSAWSVEPFRRTRRALDLTDTGEAFYQRCRRILADVEEAESAVSQAHGTLRGRRRWRSPSPSAWPTWGPPSTTFSKPIRRSPSTWISTTGRRTCSPRASTWRCGSRTWRTSTLIAGGPAPVRHVVLRESRATRPAHGTPKTAAELADHACLVYAHAPTPGVWEYLDPAGRPGRVQVKARLQANNGDCLPARRRRAARASCWAELHPLSVNRRGTVAANPQ